MNTETKRHIDAARQVLVGVVPNPSEQINQITYALIYKFMDDMDQAAIKAEGEPSFFVDELERYSWSRLMSTTMGNQERMNLYAEAFIKFSEAKQLPELFRSILKSAYLPYRSPETLGLFLKEIAYFDYSHPEDLGDAYEYLLSIMSSQGDAGQFRTPRHIIDFMVDVINPTKDDRVLDPACGTGGFLVKSYQHILEQHDGLDDPEQKEKPLNPDQRRMIMNNFEGYDIDPSMVRIAQVNMYLHQFKNPKIYGYDTLSNDERWGENFDVILANPPFMSPKGGIRPHNKFSIASTRSEVRFVDYIMNHLKPKGRAGIIVPEGIIFQSGTAYKQLRKNLVEDGLYAVVSLPSGVFAPYSGVKTSILLFNNQLAKQKSEILFVKVESDGFDLGAQRRESKKNDLPQALSILNKWKDDSIITDASGIQFLAVPKSKIAEDGDYNLSGDRYKVVTDYSKAKWPMVALGNEKYFSIISGGTPDSKNETFWNGNINWATLADIPQANCITDIRDTERKITQEGLKNSSAKLLPINSILVSSRATIGRIATNSVEVATNQGFKNIIINDTSNVDYKYVAYALTNKVDEMKSLSSGGTFSEISKTNFSILKIPLPPLVIQEQIVAELDGYQNIISGAKQIVQNWKPKIDIDPEWEKVKLGEVCEKLGDGLHGTPIYSTDGDYYFINGNNLLDSSITIKESTKRVTKEEYEKYKKELNDRTILVSINGTLGNVAIYNNEKVVLSKSVCYFNLKNDINKHFLKIYLQSSNFIDYAKRISTGSTIQNVSLQSMRNLILPLPPLEIQNQIVEKIEAERAYIDGTKKLIEIYEQKTKAVIAKLWEE
jgi:type I restriction enzyme M protein